MRVLIVAPHGRDSVIAASILKESGLPRCICADLPAMMAEFPQGVRGGVQPKFAAFAVKCDNG